MAKLKTRTARVLEDITLYGRAIPCNSLIEISEDMVLQLAKSGSVDTAKDAVNYCRNEGLSVLTLTGDDALPTDEDAASPASVAPADDTVAQQAII